MRIRSILGAMGEGKNLTEHYTSFIALIVFLFCVPGCGYRIYPQNSLPTKEIRIAPVENKTHEPKLQDKLHKALTEEFIRQGLMVSSDAEYTLVATVNSFEMFSMSEKEDVAVDYRVVVGVDVRIIDRSGKVVETKNITSPFIVTVTASQNLGTLLALKEVAEVEAMRDIAMEIAGAFLYR